MLKKNIILLLIVLLACGDGGTTPTTPVATSITLSATSLNFSSLGETQQLSATVTDQNGTAVSGASLSWTASSALVATVSSTGLVTATGNGTATITATSGSLSATGAVTVSQVATAIELSDATVSLSSLGDTTQLTATVKDSNGNEISEATVTWQSSNDAVATVSSTGWVTAIASGSATVTATSALLNAASSVTVTPAIRITFLDVGQGDGILIRSPEGKTALVDAGPSSPVGDLRALDVTQIDLLVATHPHADHVGGMAHVIDSIPVSFYMDNGQPYTTATYQTLTQALQRKTNITHLTAETRTISLGSADIDVLAMPPSSSNTINPNNRSVGLVIKYGSFITFLSGDSEIEELSFWVQQDVVPDVAILKAPHHGANDGFTSEFLLDAKPEVVVIQVGSNTYGHPGAAALQAYTATADRILRNDQDGQVTVHGFEDGSYEITVVGQGISATSRVREENPQMPTILNTDLLLDSSMISGFPSSHQQTLDRKYTGPFMGLADSFSIGAFVGTGRATKTVDGDGPIFYKVSGKPTMRYIYEW